MTDQPHDQGHDDAAPSQDSRSDSTDDTDFLPSTDPRQASEPEHDREAPPVDIDDRDEGESHAEPPDLIELPDHGAQPEDTDRLKRPLDHEFEPLPFDDDVAGETATTRSNDAGTNDLEPTNVLLNADSTQVADSAGASVYERGYEPEFEPLSSSTTSPNSTVQEPAAVDNDAGQPPERDGSSNASDQSTQSYTVSSGKRSGFFESLSSAAKSARSSVGAKTSSLAEGANEQRQEGSGFLGGFGGPSPDFLDPTLKAVSTLPHRLVTIGGAILILLFLLSNNAGLALIVASAIVPVLIALTLNQQDLFEKESTLLTLGAGAAGLIIGVIISALASWLTNSNWFDNGVLNYGAAGFGGRFADFAGSAPVVVWFLNGLVLPLLGLGAIVGVPIAMRRWPQFRNEVMDGVILAGTSGAGYAIGCALVFWAPMVSDRGPQTNVSEWTLTMLGVVLLRPVVITLAGAMLGAGVWNYLHTPHPGVLIVPAVGSIGGILLLSLGSLQLQPSGLWPEFVWTLLLAVAGFLIYRLVLNTAITTDRKALGENRARVVCPSCRKITPNGAFCAHCGAVLEQPPSSGM